MFFNDSRLITLLTDFGLQDVYVGVLKGAIAQVNPHLRVIDLTHQLPPQNIAAGSFCLMNAVPYFPPDTVHLAVVDPGVGSQRRPVAVEFSGGFLVGPDNGLFSAVLQETPALAAVSLTNRQYWRIPSPSATFHGRDIFAPVGAYLASGVPLEALGEAISPESLVMLPFPVVESTPKGIKGCIQYIDIFGNLVTNIPSRTVIGENWSVVVGKIKIPSGKTYSDVEPGEIIALIGSHGWVEIAVNGGNAQSQLQLNWGDVVLVL